jgi:CelD/BcsL family acetyltransferase involved in cellulose biosynthesis
MTDKWITSAIPFKFRLGEFTLCTKQLQASKPDVHFRQLPDTVAETPELVAHLKESAAIYISSHPTDKPLRRVVVTSKFIRYAPLQYNHYYIEFTGTFADYLAKFSSKTRSTLKRKVKKFAERSGGEVAFRSFSKPHEIEGFYKVAREVSSKTYQDRLFHSGLPDTPQFAQQLTNLASKGQVRAYLLFDGTRPIAYLYCPMIDGILYYDFLGYDPEYSEYSPGTILQYFALEQLFAEGIARVFDFTQGGGSHKEFFATHCVSCADIYYFRPSVRSLALVIFHASLTTLSAILAKIAKAIGIKDRLKKLIRSQA